MTNKKKHPPRFASLNEEAEFWDHHSPLDYDFKPARVQISPRLKKRLISIRLYEPLLLAAKHLAAKKRIPYQTFLYSLLEQSLRKELRKAA